MSEISASVNSCYLIIYKPLKRLRKHVIIYSPRINSWAIDVLTGYEWFLTIFHILIRS